MLLSSCCSCCCLDVLMMLSCCCGCCVCHVFWLPCRCGVVVFLLFVLLFLSLLSLLSCCSAVLLSCSTSSSSSPSYVPLNKIHRDKLRQRLRSVPSTARNSSLIAAFMCAADDQLWNLWCETALPGSTGPRPCGPRKGSVQVPGGPAKAALVRV